MGFRERHSIPDLGVGVGCRTKHYPVIFGEHPAMDWFEIISENFMVDGGKPLSNLEQLVASYRVVPHGVSMSIGTTAPLDRGYLARLKALLVRIRPPWCSDHLCWTGVAGNDVHDLLPLPHTEEAIAHVAQRIRAVQDTLETPFAIENVSSYVAFQDSAMPEWEFVARIAEAADCGILLDCNNIYVSSRNHGFDPEAYIDGVPADRVVQIHLAGHTDKGTYLLDTHSDHVCDAVWQLYRRAIRRTGAVSTLIEWDEDIPEFDVLAAEAALARATREDTLGIDREHARPVAPPRERSAGS